MAILTPQTIPVDGGLTPIPDPASAGGDEAPTGNGRILYVINVGAAGADVTVATPGTVKGLDVQDVINTVAVGDVWLLPLTDVFRNPSTGRASVTYTDNTVFEVAVLEPER